jgi:precorrin-6Y C5,15-methyltransferase (decarboxylating)
MLDRGLSSFRAYVCENLGSPDERVTQCSLTELAGLEFDPLHVLILVRERPDPAQADAPSLPLRFGNADEAFSQNQPRRFLATQAEVRAVALAQLNVRADSVVWDIGTGSGSVAIEAARLAPRGRVFAVEPKAADVALMQANIEQFDARNVEVVVGRAPEALGPLPDPDAIFVGGMGRQVGTLLRAVYDRLRPDGRLVVNVAAIDSLVDAHRILKSCQSEVQVWNIGVARGIEQLDRLRFQAVNPSFLMALTKREPAPPLGAGL